MNLTPCIIVTGAWGGIGQAIVASLLQHPDFTRCAVIALDAAPAPASHQLSDHPRVISHRINVADQAAVTSLAQELKHHYFVVALVNAAGVLAHGPALDTSAEDIQRIIDVNIRGIINATQAFTQVMVEQTPQATTHFKEFSRSLLTIASNAANVPRAGMALYGASKAFASHYTRSVALEVASYGIRGNVVSPGTTRTPMTRAMWGNQDKSDQAITGDPQTYRLGIPLLRIADSQDIASPCVFVLTSAAQHITLQEITIDGGATQR